MAWQDSAIPFLRILINDVGTTKEYSTCRLEELLVISAHLIKQELYFPITYTVSIPALTISPDPEEEQDSFFVNFMVLKAACLVDQSTFRTKAALEGIKATVGPANLSVAGHLSGFQKLLELGPCQAFKEMKKEYQANQCLAYTVQAILTPFVSSVFHPQDSLGGESSSHRSGYLNDEQLF